MLGPFLRGAHAPVFTATSFRDELCLVLDSWDGIPEQKRSELLAQVDGLLGEISAAL